MGTNWAKLIADQYEQMLAAKKAQLQTQQEKKTAAYQQKLKESAKQYQTLANEAYVQNALEEQARKESMANMGLSGAGGTAQMLEKRNTGRLHKQLDDAAQQQQGYGEKVNNELASLDKQYSADIANAESKTAEQRNKALISQSRWQANYDLDQQQTARRQQESIFKQAYSLYEKRLITAAQFEAMTGIRLRK